MTVEDNLSGPAMDQQIPKNQRRGRTHRDYWASRLRKKDYRDRNTGEAREIPGWQVRFQHAGTRRWYNTGTDNKASAAAKAQEFYQILEAEGWDAALAKMKPGAKRSGGNPTVGEFLKEVESQAALKPKTFATYARKFRKVVADIRGISDRGKYDYRGGGTERWRERIESVRMADITPTKIQKWKVRFVRKAGSDPIKIQEAKRSVNTFIRNSKALFARKVLKFLSFSPTNPFNGIEFEDEGSMRYRSEISPEVLIVAAQKELAVPIPPPDPNGDKETRNARNEVLLKNEMFKALLLTLMAGLRRNEADKLLWSQVRFSEGVIRIETNRYIQPKSADSIADVDVDDEVMEILRRYLSQARGQFVLESRVAPRPDATYEHYRCNRTFRALKKWLQSKGLHGVHYLHTLRKELGSVIAARHGLYAAQQQLRHSSPQLTARIYLTKKERATTGLGALLKSGELEVIDGKAS